MSPLFSVCAASTLKMSSCLRMPVAPGTSRSLAICVNLEMDISLSVARLKVSPPPSRKANDSSDASSMSVSASTSGGNSAVAAADLPASLSDAPLALALLVRVRVIRSFDISDFLFGAAACGRALSQLISGARRPRSAGTSAVYLSDVDENDCRLIVGGDASWFAPAGAHLKGTAHSSVAEDVGRLAFPRAAPTPRRGAPSSL